MEFAHPCRCTLDAELLHLSSEELSGAEGSVDFTKVAVVLFEEIHHVLIGNVNIWVSTQAPMFLNRGLASGKRTLDFLLNGSQIIPQKQRGFRLTAAHFVPGHPHSKVVVGRGRC